MSRSRRLSLTITSEQEALPFAVETDDGHRAGVDPTCARISAGYDHTTTHKIHNAATLSERERALLLRLGVAEHRQLLLNGVRFREAILEVEETITVVGAGVREPDPHEPPGGGYRESGRTWLRLVGTERHPVFITDDARSL